MRWKPCRTEWNTTDCYDVEALFSQLYNEGLDFEVKWRHNGYFIDIHVKVEPHVGSVD